MLACGTEGSPLDVLTAARLARDGERPSPVRHMCSGQHTVFILLAKLGGWEPETYWQEEHPAHAAYRETVADVFGVPPTRLVTGIDGCGVLTYAFPLRDIARAYAMLADPGAIPSADPRAPLAKHLYHVRDAMIAHPELVAGNRDRLDTSLMKAAPGRVVAKSGMEAVRGVGHPGRSPRGGFVGIRTGPQDRRWRRVRASHVVRHRRGAPPDRGARGPGAPGARPVSPAAQPRPARPGRGRDDARVRARAGGRAHRLTLASRSPGSPHRATEAPAMSFQGDPHRTLGVAPGASLNEIKSAYRRLAKKYHPDAAGERALPRFLAIQAAYEQLVDGEGRLRPPGPDPAREGATGRARPGTPGARGGRGVAGDARRAVRRAVRRAALEGAGAAGGSEVPPERVTPRASRHAGEPERPVPGAHGLGRASGPAGPASGRAHRPGRAVPREARSAQGHPGIHHLRRGRRDSARPGVGRRRLVRTVLRDVLDAQPARVRGSPQARAGVPRAPRPGAAARERGRRTPSDASAADR